MLGSWLNASSTPGVVLKRCTASARPISSIRSRRWLLGLGLALCEILLWEASGQAGVLNASWTAPTTNTDGSPLTDLGSYRIYYSTAPAPCPGSTFVQVASSTPSPGTPPATVNFSLTGLTTGTRYQVAVTAVDLNGNESACSPAASAVARERGAISIWANQSVFTQGSTLVVSVAVENSGIGETVDFYLGVLLPDGDTVVSFTDLKVTSSVGSLSNPATMRPIGRMVDLSTPLAFNLPGFFRYTWTGGEPPGTYVLFLAAVKAGAFADNSIHPGDIIALSTAPVAFAP